MKEQTIKNGQARVKIKYTYLGLQMFANSEFSECTYKDAYWSDH